MRRAFTLIELIVSTVILFIIVFALAKAYSGLKTGIDVAKKAEIVAKSKSDLIDLIYADFVQGVDFNITKGRDFDFVVIGSSKNSLYDAPNSSVAYIVTKPDKKLMRIESTQKIALPITASDLYRYHYLELTSEISGFKIYRSKPRKSSCTMMIFIDSDKPIVFEFALLNQNSC